MALMWHIFTFEYYFYDNVQIPLFNDCMTFKANISQKVKISHNLQENPLSNSDR